MLQGLQQLLLNQRRIVQQTFMPLVDQKLNQQDHITGLA